MSSVTIETQKKDMLGLNQIMAQDDVGQRKYRKCQKCNRPTFGHAKPGYGPNKCVEVTVATDEQCHQIFKDLYAAKEGQFEREIENTRVNNLVHCEVCSLDFCYKEDFKEHQAKFHTGVTIMTCKECQLVYKTKDELVDHMRSMHYYTCVNCGFYFHGRRLYKHHEKTCGVKGKTDEERRDDLTLILEKIVDGNDLLQNAHEEQRRFQEQDTNRLDNASRQTAECLQRLVRNQTEARVPIAKEQKFPMFSKDQEYETFKKKVLMWQADSRLSKQGKVLAFTEAFDKRSQVEKSHVENLIVQGNKINFDRDDVLEQCLLIYEQFFGKTLVEKTTAAWRELKGLCKASDESLSEYVQRFGTIMAKMKNAEVNNHYMIHPRLKAILLIESSGLSKVERSNVLANVNENDDRFYDTVVESMRRTNGVLAVDEHETKT